MRIDAGNFNFDATDRTLGLTAQICESTEWTLVVNLQFDRIASGVDRESAGASRSLALLTPPLRDDHKRFVVQRENRIFIKFQPRPDWLPWLQWPRVSESVRAVEISDDRQWQTLASCVGILQESSNQTDAFSEAVAMNALERIFLLVHSGHDRRRRAIDRRIARVIRLVKRELGKDITIEAAASVVGLSPSRLSHLFREQLGVTFSSYVQMERLNRARIMLEDPSLTTEKIARDLGMDPAYFSAWFRKWSGLSPRSYRSSWAK